MGKCSHLFCTFSPPAMEHNCGEKSPGDWPISEASRHTCRDAFRCMHQFIGAMPLGDEQLCQLVPDRNREGCRALYRMHAPVPQND